jgi:hypothetical protein
MPLNFSLLYFRPERYCSVHCPRQHQILQQYFETVFLN